MFLFLRHMNHYPKNHQFLSVPTLKWQDFCAEGITKRNLNISYKLELKESGEPNLDSVLHFTDIFRTRNELISFESLVNGNPSLPM